MKGKRRFRSQKIKIALVAAVLLGSVFSIGVQIGKTRGWPFVKRCGQYWSIGIYTGRSISSLRSSPNVNNPVLTAEDITDVPAAFLADPFMINHNNKWYMFFEVWNLETGHGDIGLATSDDGCNWNYEQIVLDEYFHLSYPYVFKWKNEFYMVPESSKAYSVLLYRAVNFPVEWSFERTLLSGKYVDTSVFRFNKRWWLFTSEVSSDILRLFYAEDLTGPWAEHPKSPVIEKNASTARPAGRVLVSDGRLIRFAQDCKPTYGNQVRAFEITKLGTVDYEEKELPGGPILKASGTGWNAEGMHHLDLHAVDGNEWIGCVDGRRPLLLFGLKY